MAFRDLTPIASINSFLCGLRGFLDGFKFLIFIMVLSCATFRLVTPEPCPVGGEQESHGLSFSGDISALVSPAVLIAQKTGIEVEVVVEKIKGRKWEIRNNAMTDEYENLVETDPAKVTRNAASVAGMMLTAQAIVTRCALQNAFPPFKINYFQAVERLKIDEIVLENWQSQGTKYGLSVLDGDELVFPMVQVGSQKSEWISMNNPSEKPVIMQLILNSGEIIEKCKGTHSSMDSVTPSWYCFSIADMVLMDAYVQAHLLGPIVNRPWALLGNNISGVEWISLKGLGASVSSACSEQVLKELYVKNTEDLPLEVPRIKVSRIDCRNGGGFAIAPDVELVVSSGILAVLSPHVLGLGKRSVVWYAIAVALLMLLVVVYLTKSEAESNEDEAAGLESVRTEESESVSTKTEKGRRRRRRKKKKKGKLLEAVSQSGNSTPSSPLSPLMLTSTAPGFSKLCHTKPLGTIYDMWADHFSTIPFIMNSDSDSFFVSTPHSYFANSTSKPNT